MPKPRPIAISSPLDSTSLKQRKPVPHEFVVDAISELAPRTRSLFGCVAVYVGEKIIFALRDKRDETADNGVWIVTSEEQHESLRREFPNMRSIRVLGRAVTGWQLLPTDAPDFEQAALRACDLVKAGDPRIGKVPKRKAATRRASKLAST